MTRAAGNRIDIATAAAVVSLTAENAWVEARVRELRQEIVNLDERIEAAFGALLRAARTAGPANRTGDRRGKLG
jgi:hypothetical protein